MARRERALAQQSISYSSAALSPSRGGVADRARTPFLFFQQGSPTRHISTSCFKSGCWGERELERATAPTIASSLRPPCSRTPARATSPPRERRSVVDPRSPSASEPKTARLMAYCSAPALAVLLDLWAETSAVIIAFRAPFCAPTFYRSSASPSGSGATPRRLVTQQAGHQRRHRLPRRIRHAPSRVRPRTRRAGRQEQVGLSLRCPATMAVHGGLRGGKARMLPPPRTGPSPWLPSPLSAAHAAPATRTAP